MANTQARDESGEPNRYEGMCIRCGDVVAPYAGLLQRDTLNNKYKVKHFPGDCVGRGGKMKAEEVEPKAEPMQVDQAMLTAAVEQIAKVSAEYATTEVPRMVKQLVLELLDKARPIEIAVGKAPKITVKRSHHSLPTVLQAVVAGVNPFLVGPAGSGKTTLAEQVAECLKLKFYMAARVTSEYKLVGFVDAQGRTIRTQFREAYEHGGVFLFDEVDASDPDALTAFNAALANGLGDFPDGMVKKHKDFHAIAAGNTFGRGADRQYVGRNQLDAATLDRFSTFTIDYDEVLEHQLAGDADWVRFVQAVRKAIEEEKVRHIVSPRASIYGAKLLASGMAFKAVAEAVVWKGLPDDSLRRVITRTTNNGYTPPAKYKGGE